MRNFWRVGACLALGASAGCVTLADKGRVDDVTNKFSEVVNKSSAIIAMEAAAKTGVRRDEVVMYYLHNGNDADNLDQAQTPRSFAHFVCAGQGALAQQLQATAYLKAYSDNLKIITKPGADTFSGQWKKFKENKEAKRPEDRPDSQTPERSFTRCYTRVMQLSRFDGVSATNFNKESPAVAVAGIKTLLEAAEKVGKTALKLVNEIESRRLFNATVQMLHEDFQGRLSQDLNPDSLDDAWKRRQTQALWRPYQSFSKLMSLDPHKQSDEIIRLAAETSRQLSEYDALAKTEPPSTAVVAIAQAEESLYELATNQDLKPGDVIGFLEVITENIEQLRKDYSELETAARESTL
ncbi:hypothetical protein [Pseudomonas sp. NPDC089406]|uniref:hypothetical protein n=1 Tax=Pseudomonas sp. NPDC089406 TaxID=3364463 RepID=UPI00384AE96B